MKKNILYFSFLCGLLIQSTLFTSCNKKPEVTTPTADELLATIQKAATDPKVKDFSEAMLDTIDMFMDSALVVTRSANSSIDKVVTTKASCLYLMAVLMEKGQHSTLDRLGKFTEKNLNVQFEFHVHKNDRQYVMSLANVFLPENHDEAYVADYFDFYAYFDVKTKKCDGMICDLPSCFDDEKNPPLVLAYLKKSSLDEEAKELPITAPEYDKRYQRWHVEIAPELFDEIMNSGNIYFIASDNGEAGLETSTINLSRFKAQYKLLK